MTFKKIVSSENITLLKQGNKNDFPVGTKFIFNNDEWTVVEERKDGGDHWRKIINKSRTSEESMLLSVLLKDSRSEGFSFVKDDKNNGK